MCFQGLALSLQRLLLVKKKALKRKSYGVEIAAFWRLQVARLRSQDWRRGSAAALLRADELLTQTSARCELQADNADRGQRRRRRRRTTQQRRDVRRSALGVGRKQRVERIEPTNQLTEASRGRRPGQFRFGSSCVLLRRRRTQRITVPLRLLVRCFVSMRFA